MDWSIEDKTTLLYALRKHGVNISKISEELPFKSINEIRTKISKYENLALQSLGNDAKKVEEAPLDQWIKILRQQSSRNGHNLTSRVLNYIALFEQRQESPVNLKDCYTVLADLTGGKPSKELDVETTYFLNECFSKIAKEVKNEDTKDKVNFLESLEFPDVKSTISYQRKTPDEKFAWNNDTNVCKVPLKLLKK